MLGVQLKSYQTVIFLRRACFEYSQPASSLALPTCTASIAETVGKGFEIIEATMT